MGDMAGGASQYVGAALFGFLGVASVALFTFISVAHWVTSRAQERESHQRYGLLRLLLEHPGEESERVLQAWREQEIAREIKARRERIMGGAIACATGVGLMVMFGALAEGARVWTIGLIPMLIGLVIALSGYLERPSAVVDALARPVTRDPQK